MFDLSRELAKRGHKVSILTTDMYKPDERYKIRNPEFIDGVKIIRFKYISDLLAWKYKIYISVGMLKFLKNNLKNYDIVHLQDLISPTAIVTMFYCRKYRVPYVLTSHGSLTVFNENNLLNKLYCKIWGFKILQNASRVSAFTNDEFEQYKKLGILENKIHIIPNGIYLSEYANLPKKGNFRNKHSIKEDDPVVLYLGRIHKSKGLNTLLNAFKLLNEDLTNAKLVIVGPDEGYLQELRNKSIELNLESRVIFTGPLYDEEKLEVYVDADVHVSPRKAEPFGLTLLESSACGTPVISMKNCGISDFVEKVGIVSDYNDKSINDSIKQILNDERLINEIDVNGIKIVGKFFDWKNVALKFENLYREAFTSI